MREQQRHIKTKLTSYRQDGYTQPVCERLGCLGGDYVTIGPFTRNKISRDLHKTRLT